MKTQENLHAQETDPRLLEALASLNQISAVINQIDPSDVGNQAVSLQLIMESSIRVIPGSSAVIYMYDQAAGAFEDEARLSAQPDGHIAPSTLTPSDDAGWRSILEEHLNDARFNVRVCSSFGDVLGFLRRERYTLAVIDLSLKGLIRYAWDKNKTDEPLEGYRLLASARARGIPTIVVSGITEPQEIQRIYAEHFISAYIEKQAFDRAAFRRVVEETRMMRQSLSEFNALTDRPRA